MYETENTAEATTHITKTEHMNRGGSYSKHTSFVYYAEGKMKNILPEQYSRHIGAHSCAFLKMESSKKGHLSNPAAFPNYNPM